MNDLQMTSPEELQFAAEQDLPIVNGSYGCTIQTKKKEPKQETLEEAAEVYSKRSSASVFQENHKKDFINGAKWQQQRMYSEEDMIEFAIWLYLEIGISKNKERSSKELFDEWFEKFKKK